MPLKFTLYKVLNKSYYNSHYNKFKKYKILYKPLPFKYIYNGKINNIFYNLFLPYNKL